MKRFWICMLGCLGMATISHPAVAQSEDTKAILDALKGLGARMDGMQKQIDEIKQPGAEAPTTAEQSSSPKLPAASLQTAPAGMRPEVGWVISALPSVEGQREPDALFRFSRSKLPINFAAHLQTRQIGNWVKYRGEAQLQVYEAGRHVFFAEFAAPDSVALCSGYLKVGKTVVIEIGDESSRYKLFRIEAGERKTVSAGINLESGNQDISFLVACDNACGIAGDDSCRKRWHATQFDIQVRGPSDDAPRAFTPKEIIHMVRNKPASAKQSEPEAKKSSAGRPENGAQQSDALPWTPSQ